MRNRFRVWRAERERRAYRDFLEGREPLFWELYRLAMIVVGLCFLVAVDLESLRGLRPWAGHVLPALLVHLAAVVGFLTWCKASTPKRRELGLAVFWFAAGIAAFALFGAFRPIRPRPLPQGVPPLVLPEDLAPTPVPTPHPSEVRP